MNFSFTRFFYIIHIELMFNVNFYYIISRISFKLSFSLGSILIALVMGLFLQWRCVPQSRGGEYSCWCCQDAIVVQSVKLTSVNFSLLGLNTVIHWWNLFFRFRHSFIVLAISRVTKYVKYNYHLQVLRFFLRTDSNHG